MSTVEISQLKDPVARQRHPWRLVSGLLVIALVIMAARGLWGNRALDHSTIAEYLTYPSIMSGLKNTIVLALISMVIGVVAGFIVALMRLSRNPVLRAIGFAYVAIVRSIPLLLLILFVGNISLFWSGIDVLNPITGELWYSWDMNDLITPFVASIIALALNEAAYMAEIIRSGLSAVDTGQQEAANALGLGPLRTMFRVILPQALRIIIPPTGSQFITMIKMTSLVSVIAGGDLLTEAQNIAATNLRTLELLVVAFLWYLVVTGIATIGQSFLERRLARGQRKGSV
ncbi:amino acid ABC transporter permease [Glutamicibacter creatinolyticus]|uniref:Amino acid ABC transporter permease n=2 Tax=Glutamicibacter creatinolyticus TaxID=162496 RepID=A0A5B7WWA8_9MICC|nr:MULTISPECIES: amino acid ABC transporter permease [Glutamicibacter]QCY48182.1 Amino acid ABC transporter permease [Glutamicibacter creatinolyticus]TLK52759.1 amino acid ABC transporter permease [Glutamicibacter sp. V16R2B1]